jgi:hypothetical protein
LAAGRNHAEKYCGLRLLRNGKLFNAICLVLFAAHAVSAARGQSVQSATAEPLRVVCQKNQLTIAANDSTLANILNEVRKCTGAKIDVPVDAADSRFFDTIGPGPVREVLATLLTASGYNFVIGSSDLDPDKVETVLLTARAEAPADVAGGDRSLSPARRAFEGMRQNRAASLAPESSQAAPAVVPEAAVGEQIVVQSSGDTTANPAAVEPSPVPPSTDATPAPLETSEPTPVETPASQQPKSVQDQITNMQELFEQRQKMMQNPNAPQQ